MSGLHFEHGWEDPAGAEGDECRATWGSLAVFVNDLPVSKFYDKQVRSVATRLSLPLYPVAEWMVENWWSILHEVDNRHNINDPEYPVRHDLNRATGAFALPPLRFSSLGDAIELRWRHLDSPSKMVEFLSQGSAILDRHQVEGELTRFITIVIERLLSMDVEDTRLQLDWQAIQTLDQEELAFCKAAALAGLDPFDISKAEARRLEAAAAHLPENLLEDLLAILKNNEFDKARGELNALERIAREHAAPQRRLAKLRDALHRTATAGQAPFRVGYARAVDVRKRLGLNGHLLATTGTLMDAVQLDDTSCVRERQFDLSELEGYIGYRGKYDLCVVLGSKENSERGRFKLARCLHEFLYREATGPHVVTKADSFQQRINRSFAAELLAPSKMLAKRVGGKQFVDFTELEDLATEFGVSSWLIKHQLENHEIAKLRSSSQDGDGYY